MDSRRPSPEKRLARYRLSASLLVAFADGRNPGNQIA